MMLREASIPIFAVWVVSLEISLPMSTEQSTSRFPRQRRPPHASISVLRKLNPLSKKFGSESVCNSEGCLLMPYVSN